STLRQQEFRSRVLMSRRSEIFKGEFEDFLTDPKLSDITKSETGFLSILPAYRRPLMLESIRDFVYAAALEDEEAYEIVDTAGRLATLTRPRSKIQAFVRRDEQQKRGGKLLGYDLLKSTVFKDFILQEASSKPLDKLPTEKRPRECERVNLV